MSVTVQQRTFFDPSCSSGSDVFRMLLFYRPTARANRRLYIGWQWRNFVPYLCRLIFRAILWVKLAEMFATVISLKYALLVSGLFLNQLVQFYLNNTLNRRPLTPHIIPCYTHKMVIVDRDHRSRDVTSPHVFEYRCVVMNMSTVKRWRTRGLPNRDRGHIHTVKWQFGRIR